MAWTWQEHFMYCTSTHGKYDLVTIKMLTIFGMSKSFFVEYSDIYFFNEFRFV